jgi:hypothetical protein|tara:strand:+ start:302 stop:448 length:147 start_codon:yes stop_codon:yes gene_type:complete
MRVGSLVQYMSRVVLVTKVGSVWIHGIELGEDYVSKYKISALSGVISE